ncbi:MAG: helix-turn-helix transcriptional regulator [Bacteroidales bacterium]|nr:helix-turn-helix transcriptional regulator [Bacteroidales bacterium]
MTRNDLNGSNGANKSPSGDRGATKRRRYVQTKPDNRGKRLKPFRDCLMDKNMTVTEFASRLGLSRQTINFRWNSDDCTISNAEEMAEVLGYKFTWKLEPLVKDFGEE